MIIGISGKIGSGKDTLAQMIQDLQPEMNWQVKKFAGKLKAAATLITGVPVEKWEEQEFKKQYMGDEWGMTYREFLQRLGTDAMRNGLHTNVWVNALMSDYRLINKEFISGVFHRPEARFANEPKVHIKDMDVMSDEYRMIYRGLECSDISIRHENTFPNWLITDVRFPNEAEALRGNGMALVRINRNPDTGTHPSETSLDHYGRFDFEISNTGTLQDLFEYACNLLSRISVMNESPTLDHVKRYPVTAIELVEEFNELHKDAVSGYLSK